MFLPTRSGSDLFLSADIHRAKCILLAHRCQDKDNAERVWLRHIRESCPRRLLTKSRPLLLQSSSVERRNTVIVSSGGSSAPVGKKIKKAIESCLKCDKMFCRSACFFFFLVFYGSSVAETIRENHNGTKKF